MMHRFRQFWTNLLAPVAELLLRLGVTPDAVTLVGTLGVSAGALVFFPQGELWIGVLVITAFAFSDLIDGYMARSSGNSSRWGAFLDSTLDRIGDAAIFGGLVLYFAIRDDMLMACVALYCLVMGSVTSYARARAESLGMRAEVGIAARADRLVAVLVLTFFSDVLGLPILLDVVLWALAAASTVTVVQRMAVVRRQAMADPAL
ncbi:MAG: CDP-alcohol phosphatidyltransferase family protein [Nocardioidaceae bacterium]|jgi:CDP-diacylglycerol--glycerol-3-phosphate 3-phosphatidyltransferase/CDP-diacylglycerol--inositol 3-phosphatidyltransferase|nr:CDP-alcohol phosphatidyltransferase family protein [Nocardioidaceae bacterium]